MKNMSFSMTTPQYEDGSKDITRRLGWWNLKRGDVVMAVEKAMGLKKGEKMRKLGPFEVVSVRVEPLKDITQEDVIREGFPNMSPMEFCSMLMKSNKKIFLDTPINRIEFKRLPQ